MKKKSPPKLRVLYITPSLSTKWGGPPRVAVQLAEAVQKKGLSCTIYTIDAPPKDTTISSRFINISNFSIGWQAHWWPAYSIDLSQTLTREAKLFDIIHIHELWHYANFAAYRTAIRQKIPYIITIHGALEDWALNYKARKKQLYMWLVQRRILKKANGLHVFTEWEAKRLRRLDGFRRIAVIPNGIDMEGLSNLPPREKFEMIYPELRGKKVLLFLGRIHPIKGLDILAKAFGNLVQEEGSGKIYLVIAGPDENGYRSTLESLLEAEGVLKNTIFTNTLEGNDKLAALARADILVQPSYSEGFSTTVLEALACGIPVLITTKCNFPEIQEMEAGKVIEPDAGNLSTALKHMLSDSQMLKKMGENGKKLVREKYNWNMIAEQMIQFYEAILR